MQKKYYFALFSNLLISVIFLGFVFLKPYTVDNVFDVEGKNLGFKGIYDNPVIYFVILLGFVSSFVNILIITYLYFKNTVNLYKKWVVSALLSIFVFLAIFLYHLTLVRYSTLSPEYKQELQERLGTWNQKSDKQVTP